MSNLRIYKWSPTSENGEKELKNDVFPLNKISSPPAKKKILIEEEMMSPIL
jgi:hypothetical protein